jgi:hypothetical protein
MRVGSGIFDADAHLNAVAETLEPYFEAMRKMPRGKYGALF